MNKELQDKAWAVLPKEFREEVKKLYAKFYNEKPHSDCSYGYLGLLIELFDIDNLTFDEDGEEVLTVPRSKVQEVYKISKEVLNNNVYGSKMYSMHLQIMCVLENLFGPKCLPDNVATPAPNVDSLEQKPVQPKFKSGDLALYLKKSIVRIIEYHLENQKYYVHRSLDNLKFFADESDLEPYTELGEKEEKNDYIKSYVGCLRLLL